MGRADFRQRPRSQDGLTRDRRPSAMPGPRSTRRACEPEARLASVSGRPIVAVARDLGALASRELDLRRLGQRAREALDASSRPSFVPIASSATLALPARHRRLRRLVKDEAPALGVGDLRRLDSRPSRRPLGFHSLPHTEERPRLARSPLKLVRLASCHPRGAANTHALLEILTNHPT